MIIQPWPVYFWGYLTANCHILWRYHSVMMCITIVYKYTTLFDRVWNGSLYDSLFQNLFGLSYYTLHNNNLFLFSGSNIHDTDVLRFSAYNQIEIISFYDKKKMDFRRELDLTWIKLNKTAWIVRFELITFGISMRLVVQWTTTPSKLVFPLRKEILF